MSNENKITVLGKTFNSEDERREYFRTELRKKLPELKLMEGFPIGEDDDIINLSDPPYYTACPNPWLSEFVQQWEKEKKELEKEGVRLASSNVIQPFPEDIQSGKNHSIYNAHSYHTKVPHEITSKFIFYYTQPGDIILDSFAGTGMSGVGGSFSSSIKKEPETLFRFRKDFSSLNSDFRIGKRNVINIDLSSIASHISHVYNTDFNFNSFEREYLELKEYLNDYKDLYETSHSNSKGKINYVVYAQLFNCNECQNEFNYFDSAYINENELVEMPKCPHCGLQEPKNKLSPVYKTFFDPLAQESANQISFEAILINYSVNKKRFTKSPDLNDLKNISIKEIPFGSQIPITELIHGVETRRNEKYGFTKVHHFYTDRTLNFISCYLHKIREFKNKNHFIFLLTAILPKLTKLNRFMPQHGSRALVGPMANTLYIPPLFVENNFIDQLDFQYNKIVKALNLCSRQIVSQQSATDLSNLAESSIDYVFVDPPFGANIMYSELNNLSEAWLKVLTNSKEEAIESKGQNKGKFEYDGLMLGAFKELYRVLKPNGWMTIEFSNTSAAIWNIIQNGISRSGFVIAKVDALNKSRGGLHAMLGPVAVKQDLVITCYKPNEKLTVVSNLENDTWEFVHNHLNHLPIHVLSNNSTTAIIERSPKILFDRLIAFYVQRGLPVPIDAGKFQQGLKEHFIERDGMYFTNEQVQGYDKKKSENPEFIQLSILVSSEQDGVLWLKNLLSDKSLAYQDIQPLWMQALAGVRKGDIIPELADILEDNFLKDPNGKWYVANPENEVDLEKLRNKRLLKQFENYKEEAAKPKGKIKEARVEALRVGFKQCYQEKDFKTIVQIGDRIPNNLLMEDEVLLQFYDIAISRV